MMARDRILVIDFDSTIVQVEALDELAGISLKGSKDRDRVVAEIAHITQLGMEGRLSIDESLEKRIRLLKANRSHLGDLVKLLKRRVTPSFTRNKAFLKKHAAQIYVFTAGFKEYVMPVVKDLGLREDHVFANEFTFDKKGTVTGFVRTHPLAKKGGKILQLKALKPKKKVFVIGDGYTDLEMKESGLVERFFAFTENVTRDIVVREADAVVRSFDEFLFQNKLPMSTSYPKSKIRAVLLEGIHDRGAALLKAEGYQVEAFAHSPKPDELRKLLQDASLLGIRSKTQITRPILEAAKKLIGIGTYCIGTDQTDLEAAASKGVIVFNAPFSNTRSVVELALGEMIVLLRRIVEASQKLHQGVWHKSAAGSYEIRGKKLGIVGYGNIGSQLSVLAEALGMEVYFFDLVDKLALGNAKRTRSLHDLLRTVDIVTIHVDGRATNTGLIGEREFDVMRPGAIFLNLSRGHIVDIPALARALSVGKIAGAAVDVFPHEPASNKEEFVSELRGLPNLILTPHIGGSTLEAQEHIAEYVSKKLIEYVNTGSSFFSVNFPNIQLPTLHKAHRLLHVHHNVPGILAEINSVLAKNRINILGQYLKTLDEIGYVITDVDREYPERVTKELREIAHTIKFRVLY